MNRSIIKLIKYFTIISLVLVAVTFILDDLNIITRFFPRISNNYDWLNLISSIIGGLISSIGTFIGINLTIKSEKEEAHNKEIEEQKRKGYSYLVLAQNNTAKLELALDSKKVNINEEDFQNVVISNSVTNTNEMYYFTLELEFNIISPNIPTAVRIKNLYFDYDNKIENNQEKYLDFIIFDRFNDYYMPITLLNNNIAAFSIICLVTKTEKDNLFNKLIKDKKIGIIFNADFINPNGISTEGIYRANLRKINYSKIGNEKAVSSNKIRINYNSSQTYLTIKKISYVDDYNKKLFGKTNWEKLYG